MKKLYAVEVKAEVVVVAESEREAERIASGISRYDLDLWSDATELTIMPGDWEEDLYPFVARGVEEKTIAEWIKDGAGEALLKARAAWDERVKRAREAKIEGSRAATPVPCASALPKEAP